MSLDPLVEAVSQRLDLIYNKADSLIKTWFKDLKDERDRRITILATMKQLVTLMQIEAGVPPSISPAPPAPPAVPQYVPSLDIGEIDALVWTTYKTKEKAQPGQAAWTFSDPQRHGSEDAKTVEELVKAMKASKDGKLELGDMEYSFSGNEKQFISRRPVRQK